MSRRGVVWLLTLPLAVVGSQLGHALAYRLLTSNEAERAHELAATGHAYLADAPAALADSCAVVAIASTGRSEPMPTMSARSRTAELHASSPQTKME